MARKKHLISLEALVNEEPVSLIARLREVIPLIEASVQAGHSLKSIHQRLNEAGFDIRYNTLATYRRRLTQGRLGFPPKKSKLEPGPEAQEPTVAGPVQPDGFDPAANFRKHAKKQVTWEYPSGPPDESKLV